MLITVTGATGHLGRRIVHQLSKTLSPNQIRIGAHNPSKAAALKEAGFQVAHLDYPDSRPGRERRGRLRPVVNLQFDRPGNGTGEPVNGDQGC